MRSAIQQHALGVYPGHHLWGMPSGTDAQNWLPLRTMSDFTYFQRSRAFLNRVFLHSFGDPVQLASTIPHLNRPHTVCYSADQWSLMALGWLKRLRLVSTPLIVVAHHLPKHTWEKAALSGCDVIFVLSAAVGNGLDELLGRRVKIEFAPWGPDLEFYQPWRGRQRVWDFVACGKTNRDYAPLRAAATTGAVNGVIYDELGRHEFSNGLVRTVHRRHSYPEVVEDMATSGVVVVPLRDPSILSGLTEIADAIALNKPVLLTVTPHNNFGIGQTHPGALMPEHPTPSRLVALIRATCSSPIPPSLSLTAHTNNSHEMERAVERVITALRDNRASMKH